MTKKQMVELCTDRQTNRQTDINKCTFGKWKGRSRNRIDWEKCIEGREVRVGMQWHIGGEGEEEEKEEEEEEKKEEKEEKVENNKKKKKKKKKEKRQKMKEEGGAEEE
jgi:hypothetical protein